MSDISENELPMDEYIKEDCRDEALLPTQHHKIELTKSPDRKIFFKSYGWQTIDLYRVKAIRVLVDETIIVMLDDGDEVRMKFTTEQAMRKVYNPLVEDLISLNN